KDTEGVVGLSQCFERMKSVFHISNCIIENQVKFATCTLHSVALTCWNTHVKIVGHDTAYSMPWKTLMKMMTEKYYPRNEIKKLEMEIWDLKVKGTDLTSYTQRFQKLADQLQAMIDQGVTATLAARDADRNTNGDDSHNSGTGVRRTERTAREFENQVKFATCTLHSVALTWWNTHVKTVGHDAAYETGNGDLGSKGEGY
ncbi:reverse transcriptase domain-containing protein, partial [Tanacetum coccineum]